MTQPKTPEQLAEECANNLVGRKKAGDYTNDVVQEGFLAGHASRDEEIADYRAALESYFSDKHTDDFDVISRTVLDKWSKKS